MAHELESDKSFASFRQPAWHGLGTVFTEEVSTKEMLELANLHDWNVHLEEVAIDRKSTRLNSSHPSRSRMPSSA